MGRNAALSVTDAVCFTFSSSLLRCPRAFRDTHFICHKETQDVNLTLSAPLRFEPMLSLWKEVSLWEMSFHQILWRLFCCYSHPRQILLLPKSTELLAYLPGCLVVLLCLEVLMKRCFILFAVTATALIKLHPFGGYYG